MKWTVEFHDDFVSEFRNFEEETAGIDLLHPHLSKVANSTRENSKIVEFQ